MEKPTDNQKYEGNLENISDILDDNCSYCGDPECILTAKAHLLLQSNPDAFGEIIAELLEQSLNEEQ